MRIGKVADRVRNGARIDIGFRLNGVCRGGMYSTGVDAYNRCAGFRNRNRLSLVYASLGFRVCEWCIKRWGK